MTLAQHCEAIYSEYPRKVAPRKAKIEIERAIQRLRMGEAPYPPMSLEDAAQGLLNATIAYCRSPWVQQHLRDEPHFIPHPSTWFHQSRYQDDTRDWEITKHEPETLDAARKRRNAELIASVTGTAAGGGGQPVQKGTRSPFADGLQKGTLRLPFAGD